MKKLGSIIGLICVVCILSFFAAHQRAAASSNTMSTGGKTPPTHSKSKKMKLEDLMQRLEAAHPWSVEKISDVLGAELTLDDSSSPGDTDYIVNRLDYGEGLVIDKAKFGIGIKSKGIKLTLANSKDTKCFAYDYIKKTYPDISYVLPGPLLHTIYGEYVPYPDSTYQVERSWGTLSFRFINKVIDKKGVPDCLADITLTSPKLAATEPEPIVSDDHRMKLEELLQRMEAANPWSAEKVSKALGAEFILSLGQSQDYQHYKDNRGPFYLRYEENLLLNRIHLRIDSKTNKTHWLTLEINGDRSECFTLDRIKKSYPDIKYSPEGAPPRRVTDTTAYYRTVRPWGRLSFGFDKKRNDCLCDIVLTPNQ